MMQPSIPTHDPVPHLEKGGPRDLRQLSAISRKLSAKNQKKIATTVKDGLAMTAILFKVPS